MKREIWSVWKKEEKEIKVRNSSKNIRRMKKNGWECIGWAIREKGDVK